MSLDSFIAIAVVSTLRKTDWIPQVCTGHANIQTIEVVNPPSGSKRIADLPTSKERRKGASRFFA